jgi:hypothetical protein
MILAKIVIKRMIEETRIIKVEGSSLEEIESQFEISDYEDDDFSLISTTPEEPHYFTIEDVTP